MPERWNKIYDRVMDRISDIARRLVEFRDSINQSLEAATIEASETIIDMNIGQLYDRGERRDGKKISPPYSPKTVAIKKKKGQPTNRVTLRDTFEWQSSFWIQYYLDGFEIKASDWKTDRLKEKYGDEILGLQEEMIKYLSSNYYLPRLLKDLKNKLGYE